MKRLLILFSFAIAAFGQQPAVMLPWTPQQFTNTNGTILVSGKVCSYLAGTSTGTATFTDATATVSNAIPPNAILLDSTGRPTSGGIWLIPGKAYKIVTMTAGSDGTCNTGVVIKTQDNVIGAPNTYATLNGCQYVNATQTFAAALTAAATSGCIIVTPGIYPVSANATVPVGVSLQVVEGGTLSIANAVTLTINGPFLAGPYSAFTYTGSGVAVLGDNTLPVSPLWFPGADIGAQINTAYAACPSQGCVIQITPQSSGACYAFTTPIVLTTSGKPVNLVGANTSNTAGNVAGGACLNYTPLTATTAITIDWVPSVGSGYVPAGGISNLILTNTTSYTNGGPAQGGGSGSLATGIATGTTNGGLGFGPLVNVAVKGFHVGYLHQNSSAGAWGTQFVNTSFAYNDTGFQSTVATEVLNFSGGTFGVNGVALNLANTTAAFNAVHFDSNFGPSVLSGSTASNVNFSQAHFENLNVGANSCGANSAEYINSSGPSVNISGGDAADDCNTGTNTVYWFNLNGGSVYGQVLTTAGRTPSTSVYIVNGETASSINVTLPTAGSALKLLITNNSGTQGIASAVVHAANSFFQSSQYWSTAGQNTPTCTFTSGGGTSPSCTFDVNQSDSSGTIIATTGTGAPAITGTITLNFGNALGKNRIDCNYTLSNHGAGQWGSLAQVVDVTPSVNSDIFQWTNATGATPAGVALATSTAYQINYWCVGK